MKLLSLPLNYIVRLVILSVFQPRKLLERTGQNKTLVFSYLMFSLQMRIITDFEIMKLSLPSPELKTKILVTFWLRDTVIKCSLLKMKVFVQWHSELKQIEKVL